MFPVDYNESLRRDRTSRWSVGHKVLVYVVAIAVFIITLDSFVESGRLADRVGEDTELARSSAAWGKNRDKSPPLETQYMMIPIDHENLSTGSYRNRYWVNDRFYKPGGPVFLYDSGEANASDSVERFLQRPTSFIGSLLQEFHGLGLLLEHRYYGESLPFSINKSISVDALRFLTLNQSLADLPYFARNLRLKSHPGANLSPTSTPWIMLGCSYSGGRAALSRLVHPETFFAAYAGSPVVAFTPGIDGFYEAVYRDMIDHGYVNCTRDLHAVVDYVDSQLEDSSTASSVKQLFLGPGAEENNNQDFALSLTMPFMYHKGWRIGGGKPSLASVCDYLEHDDTTNRTADANGLALHHGAEFMAHKLASFEPLLYGVNKVFNTTCNKGSEAIPTRCDVSQLVSDGDTIAWQYQQCAELGYLIVQNRSSHHLVSKYLTLEYAAETCKKFFPTTPELLIPELRERISKTNRQFGGWDMRPSNVFWTTGQYDEYRSASPLAREKVDFGTVSVSAEIPACNVSTGPNSIFGFVQPEAVHCEALAKNHTQAMQTRKMFVDALREWFKCF